MDRFLSDFILNSRFPCIMAKSVLKKGFISYHKLQSMDEDKEYLDLAYQFIDEFRTHPDRLSSFIVSFTDERLQDFQFFEQEFWKFLKKLKFTDEQHYSHDPRVDSHPDSGNFSFSLKSEAFFILALHPDSPRFARRFSMPTIVFNPHVQFEKLKQKGIFKGIQKVIRKRDELLQDKNPMLADFGEKSEVFQYLGKIYKPDSLNPLEFAT